MDPLSIHVDHRIERLTREAEARRQGSSMHSGDGGDRHRARIDRTLRPTLVGLATAFLVASAVVASSDASLRTEPAGGWIGGLTRAHR